MRTLQEMVAQEVILNVGGVVAALSTIEGHHDTLYPSDDFESAATDAGWYQSEVGEWYRPAKPGEPANHTVDIAAGHIRQIWVDDAQEACEWDSIEPHINEIFEYWAISEWLADKLEAKGEAIARDLAGLTVWGRTTTGQAIFLDPVIAEIYAEATNPKGWAAA